LVYGLIVVRRNSAILAER